MSRDPDTRPGTPGSRLEQRHSTDEPSRYPPNDALLSDNINACYSVAFVKLTLDMVLLRILLTLKRLYKYTTELPSLNFSHPSKL